MKFSKYLTLMWILILSSQMIFAEEEADEEFNSLNEEVRDQMILTENNDINLIEELETRRWRRHRHSHSSSHSVDQTCGPLGVAGYAVTDPALWYTIITEAYPTTVVLSAIRNLGSTQGNVQLTPTGLLIGEEGNYSVTFTAILQNPDESYTTIIPVFLSLNGTFDPITNSNLGSVAVLLPNFIGPVQMTGILQNVPAGTSLSLIATNGGSPEPQAIKVLGWSISAFKIPCNTCCEKKHRRCH